MSRVEVAAATPCAQCPWRIANQGKRNPGSFYTKRNLARLWAGLRRGVQMTCHPTDQRMNDWDHMAVPEHVTTRECAGAVIVVQRELMIMQDVHGSLQTYRRERPRGMTRNGLVAVVNRALYGGVPLLGGLPMRTDYDLLDEAIGVPGLPCTLRPAATNATEAT